MATNDNLFSREFLEAMEAGRLTPELMWAETERFHSDLYPSGCPNLCEHCVRRLRENEHAVATFEGEGGAF